MIASNIELPYKPLFDVGQGEPIILLHGLFGNLSNWGNVAYEFTSTHRVLIPRLPLYASPISSQRLEDLVDYLHAFIEHYNLSSPIIMGNSLAGHVALRYALKYPGTIEKLILIGSSGLHENSFGGTFPRVKDYEYIRERVANTFDKSDGCSHYD